MSILHTVNKSSFSSNTLTSCLKVCSNNDAILLIEDGVFSALKGALSAKDLQHQISHGVSVYALKNDIEARGLGCKIMDNVQLTDYEGFVQLSITHRCVQSWY